MKKLFFPIFFLAFAPLLASAQNSKQYLDCSHNAQPQAAMNACADQELRRVDTELNGTYPLWPKPRSRRKPPRK